METPGPKNEPVPVEEVPKNERIISKQRIVNNRLGYSNTKDHERIYEEIEKRIGKTKKCNFGHTRGSKTGVKHEGPQDVAIRCFELKGCRIDDLGNVVITGGDGLQGFCKDCSKRRRRKRLEQAREKNVGGYETYEKNYGTKTKICSNCKEDKNVREHFKLSPGMECGIHNVCNDCSKKYGDSMGDRFIKYRPDGNFKYAKKDKGQHDDHIMPLAFGGTNESDNHRLISARENLSKSSTIPFTNVTDIPNELVCERWRPLLQRAKDEMISITEFKSRINKAIYDENCEIYSMTDEKIEDIYKQYNKKNNRRINVKRAVAKFKQYCKDMLKL